MKNSFEQIQPEQQDQEIPDFENISDNSEEFLSKKDKEVLYVGMKKLKKVFEDTPKEKMPEVITFIDLAARPLLYFLKPLIKDEYTKKGVEIPKYRFLSNFSNIEKDKKDAESYEWLQENLNELKHELWLFENEDPDDYSNWTKEIWKELNKIEFIEQKYPELEDKDEFQKMNYMRQKKEELEKETKNFIIRIARILSQSNNGSILFIDDFLNNGGTLKNINNAIKKLTELKKTNPDLIPNIKIDPELITFFAFYVEDREKYSTREEKLSSDIKVIEGSSGKEHSGFRYRDTSSIDPREAREYQKEKESIIGVEKVLGDPIGTTHSANRNMEKMRKIRNVMKKLGEEMLEDINN